MMRWPVKYLTLPSPWVRRFAWFPLNIDGTMIWLEFYEQRMVDCIETWAGTSKFWEYRFLSTPSALPENPPSTEIDVPSEPTSSALGNSDNDHTPVANEHGQVGGQS